MQIIIREHPKQVTSGPIRVRYEGVDQLVTLSLLDNGAQKFFNEHSAFANERSRFIAPPDLFYATLGALADGTHGFVDDTRTKLSAHERYDNAISWIKSALVDGFFLNAISYLNYSKLADDSIIFPHGTVAVSQGVLSGERSMLTQRDFANEITFAYLGVNHTRAEDISTKLFNRSLGAWCTRDRTGVQRPFFMRLKEGLKGEEISNYLGESRLELGIDYAHDFRARALGAVFRPA